MGKDIGRVRGGRGRNDVNIALMHEIIRKKFKEDYFL